jgi:hypothetical protein
MTDGWSGGSMDLPASQGTYQLSATANTNNFDLSTVVSAEWTFASGHAPEDAEVALPLMAVRFAPALDDRNRATGSGPVTFPVYVQRQEGGTYGQLTTLTVQTSGNGGRTWQPATVTGTGLNRTVGFDQPAGPGFLSLRATAVDTAGNTVTETITRAYTLAG